MFPALEPAAKVSPKEVGADDSGDVVIVNVDALPGTTAGLVNTTPE
ncbi:MAG: hypothetical protein HGB15_09360 [Chlorobaculum sp.]|nr:hypothetical protein [Chlorobaculum sp.]